MRIVILEKDCLGTDVSFQVLEETGNVISYGVTSYDQIEERLEEAEIAIINRCRMEANTLKNCKKLKVV